MSMKRLLPILFIVGLFNLPAFAAEKYPRKVVMEEATGTWCGYCVRGIETLKLLSANCPNNFIGIGIHSGDEMANAENYDLSSVGNVQGYPGCFINRRTEDSEGVSYEWNNYIVQQLKDDADAKIVASAYFTDATKTSVIVQTKTTFGYDISGANFKIAYVVLEDNVGPYTQRNYYSGNSSAPSDYMYEWTQKEAAVSIKFNDVARGIYPSVNGLQGSVPSTVKMGKANDYDYTFTLPSSISNKSNISIVTLLINSTTGEIVNADKVAVKVLKATIKLDKSKVNLQKGKTVTLKATLSPSILKDQSVKWKSSDTDVATVTSGGKVKGVKAGTATITCTSVATGVKATCKVTVGYVKLDKTVAAVKKGKTLTLKATVYPSTLSDKSVTWKSSNTAIATVTSAGKVKGVKAGTATITCTSNATGLSTTCKVTVGNVTLDKTEAFIEKGKTTTLKATVTPSALEDKSVTWKSSDKSIATVSSSGKVKGVGYGTATITCTSVATGLSTTCTVTVGKVVVSISEVSLKKTRTISLNATLYPTTLTDKSVTWKSSNTAVATVSSSGKVKGIKAGTAVITCTSNATGLKGTCTVTVLAVSESRSIEGDDDEATGIDEVDVEPAEIEPFDVYDLSGRKVLNKVTSLDGLPNGIYIVNGKKILKKD